MISALISRFTSKSKDTSSEFSKFFREASSREKKKVFMEVAREASAEQLKVMEGVPKQEIQNN